MKFYTPRHKLLPPELVRYSQDSLDKSNRWVMMGDLLPWTDIEKEYNSRLGNMNLTRQHNSSKKCIYSSI